MRLSQNRSSFARIIAAAALALGWAAPFAAAQEPVLPPNHPPVPGTTAVPDDSLTIVGGTVAREEGGGAAGAGAEGSSGGGFVDANFAVNDVLVLGDSQVVTADGLVTNLTATQPGGLAKAAYLGVSTSAPDAALQKQLQLKPGVGLVVDSVEAGSPAEQAGVRQYDVLHKLDEQLLINSDQLSVLVRSYEPGKEVKLTVIREGKPESMTAKLGERAVQPLRLALRRSGMMPGGVILQSAPRAVVAFDKVNTATTDAPFAFTNGNVVVRAHDGKSQVTAALVTIDDGKRKITIASPGGRKQLKVEEKGGKVVFDGPIETKEDVEKVPADVRKFYEMILRDYSAAAATPTAPASQPAPTATPPVR